MIWVQFGDGMSKDIAGMQGMQRLSLGASFEKSLCHLTEALGNDAIRKGAQAQPCRPRRDGRDLWAPRASSRTRR